jgi:hypothetical protein
VAVLAAAGLGFRGLRFRTSTAGLAGIGAVLTAEAAATRLAALAGLLLSVFAVSELSGIVLVCHYIHLSFDTSFNVQPLRATASTLKENQYRKQADYQLT